MNAQIIFDYLEAAGYDVFFPEQHIGECITPYIVVKSDGLAPIAGITTNQCFYAIFCYIPRNQYNELEQFIIDLKTTMEGLYPSVMSADIETTPFYDDEVKGFMVSIQYINYRRK